MTLDPSNAFTVTFTPQSVLWKHTFSKAVYRHTIYFQLVKFSNMLPYWLQRYCTKNHNFRNKSRLRYVIVTEIT